MKQPIFEALEKRDHLTNFVLVDAAADRDIMQLGSGGSIEVPLEGPRSLSVRAEMAGPVSFSGASNQYEANAPFALFGNNGSDYTGRTYAPGQTLAFTATGSAETASLSILFVADEDEPPEPPAPGERPGAHNTGPRFSILETRPGFTANVDGAVYERIRFTGQVTVRTNTATFRDCIFEGGRYNIEANSTSVRNLLIEYCEFTGASSAAVYGEGLTLRYSEIHHQRSDGVKPSGSNFRMEANWIHHLGMSDGSHADGVQARVTSGTWTGHFYIGNFFDMPVGLSGFNSNATIFLQAIEGGRIDNAQIIGNWLNGGNYNIHITTGAAGADFIGNHFGRNHRYGLFKGSSHIGTWSDNRWMDTGALIPRP